MIPPSRAPRGSGGSTIRRALGNFTLALCLAGSLATPLVAALLARDSSPTAPANRAARAALTSPGVAPHGQSTLGDSVWHDLNANGVEDSGEPGIGGVAVWLWKDNNDGAFDPATDTLVAQAVTGDNPSTPGTETGWYDFQIYVTNAVYWVQIVDANFAPGAPLAGYLQTNAGAVGPLPLFVYLPEGVQDYNDADVGFAKPSVKLVKRAGDTADGQIRLIAPPGGTVAYSYEVTNTGDVPLDSITVRDDNGTPSNSADDVVVCTRGDPLNPTASFTCTWNTLVTVDRTNIATALAQPVDLAGQPYPVDPISDDDDAVVIVGVNTLTPTATGTATSTPTETRTPTVTATSSATPTATGTATTTPSPTPGPSATPTSTVTPSATPTRTSTATPTLTSSATPTPSSTPTSTPTRTPTATCPVGGCVYQVYLPVLIDVPPPIPTPTPTWTPSPTLAPSATPTATVEVLGLAHPKDVVVRTDTHDIYVTSRDNNRVYRLDGATLAEEGSAVVGAQPWGIDYNPNTNKLYVADFASGDVRVLDASTLAVLRVINTGPSPTFVRVDPGSNKVYAVLYGSNALAVIDGATDTLETLAPAGGVGSWGIALNPALNRVYVSNRDSGTVTTLDGNAGYSVLGGLTRVVCGSGGSSPYAMDFNPSNNRLYVACAPNGSVNTAAIYKANSTGLTFMTFAPLGNGGPDGGGGVVANPATGLVYFTNGDADSVTIIDGSNQVAGGFATGSHPFGIALDPITGRVYVVNRDSNDLTVH